MVNLLPGVNVFNNTSSDTSPLDTNLTQIIIDFWKIADVMSAVEDKSWMFYGRMIDLSETDNFGREYTSVREKVRNFFLIDNVREKAILLVKPIGLLICEWLEFNRNVNGFYLAECLNSMVFKTSYILDYSSSIAWWVENCEDETRLDSLFCKACYFCVEDTVTLIWNKIHMKYPFYRIRMNMEEEIFSLYWIHKLKGKIPMFMVELKKYSKLGWKHWRVQSEEFLEVNISWLMLRFSVLTGNPNAVKYFFNALTFEEKLNILPICLTVACLCEIDHFTRDPKFVYIIEFLFAKMDPYQQLLFLDGNRGLFVQLIAKYWQCQIQAVPIIEMSWNEINVDFYHFIIKIIARRIAEGRYVKEYLLKSIWEVTPEYMRREFFSFIVDSAYCIEIFSERVVHEAEQILRDATIVERNKILSFYEV